MPAAVAERSSTGDGSGAGAARGFWRLAGRRLLRDRFAMAAVAVLAVILVACFIVAPVLVGLLGHGPGSIFPGAVRNTINPVGFWTRVPNVHYPYLQRHGTTLLVLGADGPLGRDELLRLLYGGQVTIEVAAIATAVACLIGVPLGATAGYVGGRLDAAVVWLVDFVMAFPVLLMAIALGATISSHFSGYTLHNLFAAGVISVSLFIGLFSFTYMARLSRIQVLELREREFVEAARMTGSGPVRILRRHILPHLLPVLLPPATVLFATAMLLQASLSVLGVGIDPSTPSWGGMLAIKIGWLTSLAYGGDISLSDPLIIYPSIAIVITVVAVAMIGEGLRKALDPAGR